MNIIAKVSLVAIVLLPTGLAGLAYVFVRSPYMTEVGLPKEQPVPYSHQQHVGGLGLDCRYCHSFVEETDFAGIPPTETCMGCHAQVSAESPVLGSVRASLQDNQSLEWIRVHSLPDYVYFNHGIHINKGIGCETCHGRIDHMPVVAKAEPLSMEWCLACHRVPERFVRPLDEIFTMGWEPSIDQTVLGPQLVAQYGIVVDQLTDCSICHR